MDDHSSKKAGSYLQANNRELELLFAKAKKLSDLNKKIAPFLDPAILEYCQVANLIGTRLILVVANGSIATQLRFQAMDLLRKFKQDPDLQKIQEIQTKVRPPSSNPSTRLQIHNNRKMRALSTETATIIRDMAESLEDPKLREIMERIATRGTKPTSEK